MQHLDLDHRLVGFGPSVIAGEFAQRPFQRDIALGDRSLNDDFRPRRDWEGYRHPIRQLHRTAQNAADDVQFRYVRVVGLRRDHEGYGVDSVGGHHLAGLAARPPGFAVEQAVLAGRTVHADSSWTLNHLSVAAHIDAARVGIAGKGNVAGTDVVAAVARPEARRGQLCHVDIVTSQDDLVHRRPVDRHMVRREPPFRPLAHGADHFLGGEIRVDSHGERKPPAAGAQHVRQHAGAALVVGDIFEQQCRCVLVLRHHVSRRGEFLVCGNRRRHAMQPAIVFHCVDPGAKIFGPAPVVVGGGNGIGSWDVVCVFHVRNLTWNFHPEQGWCLRSPREQL